MFMDNLNVEVLSEIETVRWLLILGGPQTVFAANVSF